MLPGRNQNLETKWWGRAGNLWTLRAIEREPDLERS